MLTIKEKKKSKKDPPILLKKIKKKYTYLLKKHYINQPERSKHIIIYWDRAFCFCLNN